MENDKFVDGLIRAFQMMTGASLSERSDGIHAAVALIKEEIDKKKEESTN